MRRLTALVMLLCVIGAGVYLTVTMLFKISSIQVQTADGVVPVSYTHLRDPAAGVHCRLGGSQRRLPGHPPCGG